MIFFFFIFFNRFTAELTSIWHPDHTLPDHTFSRADYRLQRLMGCSVGSFKFLPLFYIERELRCLLSGTCSAVNSNFLLELLSRCYEGLSHTAPGRFALNCFKISQKFKKKSINRRYSLLSEYFTKHILLSKRSNF